jgi:hypothetical protein
MFKTSIESVISDIQDKVGKLRDLAESTIQRSGRTTKRRIGILFSQMLMPTSVIVLPVLPVNLRSC